MKTTIFFTLIFFSKAGFSGQPSSKNPISKSQNSLIERAKAKVDSFGFDMKKVKVEDVEEELLYGVDPTGDISLNIKVVEPINYKGNTLVEGTELTYMYSDFHLISLKNGQTFKINNIVCKDSVVFKNARLCQCDIAKNYTINGFTINPPAKVMFVNDEFHMFYKSGWAPSGAPKNSGYYNIKSNGKVEKLPSDVDKFNCGG